MKLNIGEVIRNLRRDRNLTQEEFAEIFGVSYQSVSRWENGTCYPDVELLPDIAMFFSITVDKLLGADNLVEKKEVDEYLACFQEAISRGAVYECIDIARKGVLIYPNNYALLNKLMYALFVSGDSDGNIPEWRENMQKYDSEITELGERIMKYCTDTDIRYDAMTRLAFNHCEMGRKDAARRIYEQLPSMYDCREVNIHWALDGQEKLQNIRDQIKKGYNVFSCGINELLHSPLVNDNDKASIAEKAVALDLLIYDGKLYDIDYGNARNYFDLALAYARLGQAEKVYSALETTISCAIAFDERPQEITVSNLIFGDEIFKRSDLETSDSRPLCEIVRDDWLKDTEFDRLRNSNEFKALKNRLFESTSKK